MSGRDAGEMNGEAGGHARRVCQKRPSPKESMPPAPVAGGIEQSTDYCQPILAMRAFQRSMASGFLVYSGGSPRSTRSALASAATGSEAITS